MPLFWLTYRHPDGRAASVIVVETRGGLLHARLLAALAGADRELQFVTGHQLDEENTKHIPENMVGRLLNQSDLRKLHRMPLKKKPPAPSVRRRTAVKRNAARRLGGEERARFGRAPKQPFRLLKRSR